MSKFHHFHTIIILFLGLYLFLILFSSSAIGSLQERKSCRTAAESAKVIMEARQEPVLLEDFIETIWDSSDSSDRAARKIEGMALRVYRTEPVHEDPEKKREVTESYRKRIYRNCILMQRMNSN